MKIIKGEESYKLFCSDDSKKPFGEIYYSTTYNDYVLRAELILELEELELIVKFIKMLKEKKWNQK